MVMYDKNQAENWVRDKPLTIDDFFVKPLALEEFYKIGNHKIVLDMGCGEGYYSRLMSNTAKKVISVDKSEQMIGKALSKERENSLGIDYHVADVRNMPFIEDSSIDIAFPNFVAHYFTPKQLVQFYQEMARCLKSDGRFILSGVHPEYFFTKKFGEAMKFENSGYDYIKSRGRSFPGTLKTTDGRILEVSVVHSTMGDHLSAMDKSGLTYNNKIEPTQLPDEAKQFEHFKEFDGHNVFIVMMGGKYNTNNQI